MTPRRPEKAGYGAYAKLEYDDPRGKRTNIVNPDTGRLANKTILSVETPSWRIIPEGEIPAGGYGKTGVVPKKGGVKIEDTGAIKNQTIVSPRAPEWFKSAFESNRDYFESRGVAQQLKAPSPRGEVAAGLTREQVRMKKTNITDPDTGKLINMTKVSAAAPEFFKTSFENNREYFEQQGVAEQRRNPAGAELKAAGHRKSHTRMKRSNITDPHSGKIQNKTIVSKEAPDHFKTAFESNRTHFEKQGVAEKLRDSPGKRPTSAPKHKREERREDHHRSREERSGTRPTSARSKPAAEKTGKVSIEKTGKVSSPERPRSATTPKSRSTASPEKAHSRRNPPAPGAHATTSSTSSTTSRQQVFQPPPRRHR